MYTACRRSPALRPVYRSISLPWAMMSLVTESGVARGPVLMPSPASCSRTFIMSMGWMHVVAVMPARPPLMKGRAARV